uniref:Actin-interacting protein 1 n=1 Tax=Tetranychus urticae TaxID=32264 RepID=T1KFN6_TETUR
MMEIEVQTNIYGNPCKPDIIGSGQFQKEIVLQPPFDTLNAAIDVNDQSFKEDVHIKLPCQPKSISFLAKNQDKAVIAAYSSITVVNLKQNKVEQNFPVSFEPTSVSVHPSENHLAVGGQKDHKVHVYTYTEGCDSITPKIELDHRDCIADVVYSPDGQYLAVADANRKVVLYKTPNYELAHNVEWGFHTARVNCLAWSPDSIHLASGSLDTGLIVWDVSKPHNHIALKKAHPQSQITRIIWLDANRIITTGQDSNVKLPSSANQFSALRAHLATSVRCFSTLSWVIFSGRVIDLRQVLIISAFCFFSASLGSSCGHFPQLMVGGRCGPATGVGASSSLSDEPS